MGGLASKHIDELVSDSKSQSTPKMLKHIPFDPRSPSEQITRTPITMLDTPDSGVKTTPTDAKVVQVIDPRSPNNEVTRTPIIVEKKEVSRRPLSLRPKTLMKLDSLSQADDENGEEEKQDPRSPTIKVPRTPLEAREIELGDSHCNGNTENSDMTTKNVPSKEEESHVLVKRLFTSDSPVDKVRRPLASIQNTNAAKTPRDLLQAKHCKNVEDEYIKTHQTILNKLPGEENTVKSNTEFIETI